MTAPLRAADAPDRHAHYALVLLSLVMLLNIIDRSMLSVLIEPIKEELGVSDAAMGMLTGTSFALLHVVAMIPIASLADRGSRRNLIALGLGVWSTLTVLTGLARNFGEMFVVRLGLGVGEATVVPTSHSLVADYYSLERRATALSVLILAAPLGHTIALAAGGFINDLWGWRAAFFIFGVPGLFLMLVIRLTVREPLRGASDGSGGAWGPLPVAVALRTLLRLPAYRHLAVGAAYSALANQALIIWAPPFWMRAFDLGSSEVGATLALATGPSTIAGVLVAGRLADRMSSRDVRWLAWIPAITCALTLPFACGFTLAGSHTLSFAMLVPTSFLGMIAIGPVYTAVQSIAPPNTRALASAILSLLLTALGLGVGPPVVGLLTDLGTTAYGADSIRYALTAATFCFVGAVVHWLLAARSLKDELEAARVISSRSSKR